jgi:hypothetical protein
MTKVRPCPNNPLLLGKRLRKPLTYPAGMGPPGSKKLVKRHRKTGEFIGWTGYPECRDASNSDCWSYFGAILNWNAPRFLW